MLGGVLLALLVGMAGMVFTARRASAGRSPSWLNSAALRATTISNGGVASTALDGFAAVDAESSWNADNWDPAAYPQVLQIDLRRTMMISSVRYYRGNGPQPGRVHILIASDNGSGQPGAFTEVAAPSVSAWNVWLEEVFTATRGRFVRLQFNSPEERFNLSEVGVRATTRLVALARFDGGTTSTTVVNGSTTTTNGATTTTAAATTSTTAAPATTTTTAAPATTTTVNGGSTTTSAQPTTTVPSGPVSFTAAPAGTTSSFRQFLPPANAVLGIGYGSWTPSVFDTCPKELHDTYWVQGHDGKIYPTWHPAVDTNPATGASCTYGHEHGDDPRTSPHFASQGFPPFGLANGVLAASVNNNASSMRPEDHVGHKVVVYRYLGSKDNTADNGNKLTARPLPGVWCDVMMKYHQGSHSADALSNHLHEIQYHQKCTPGTDPTLWPGVPNGMEFHLTILSPLGAGGRFTNNCDQQHVITQPALPADGPDTSPNGTVDGERVISCNRTIWPSSDTNLGEDEGPSQVGDVRELWTFGVHFKTPGGAGFFGPYAGIFNPARIYDANSPTKEVKVIDLCYAGTLNAPKCTELKALGGRIAWNDPRSPWNGTERSIAPKANFLWNDGASQEVFYTDAYGRNPSYTPFPNSIKQYASRTKGMVEGAMLDHNRNTTLGAGGFENLVVRDHEATGIHMPN